jgi:hypothetical protein
VFAAAERYRYGGDVLQQIEVLSRARHDTTVCIVKL